MTGATRTISTEERRVRLARRHRLAPGHTAGGVVDAASSMVCLHATDPATVYMSARARVPGMTIADLDRALYADRSLVKHLAMRRTLFVFPREILPAVQAGASTRVADTERRNLIKAVEQGGLHADGAKWLARAEKAVLDALAEGREVTTSELRDEIPLLQGAIEYGRGRSWGGMQPIAPRVFTVLSASGYLIRATNEGRWYTSRPRWMSTRFWLGAPISEMSADQGTRDLIESWLRTFGPGTETDLKWWLGSTLTAVRKALADTGAVPVDLDGRVGHVLADDIEATDEMPPWGALLPALDPTVMGWKERDWYLGEYAPALFDTAGNAGPTVWWEGRVVGGWRQGESGEVQLQMLEDIGSEAISNLEEQAGDLEQWLEGRRVMLRFPSPLWRDVG